MKSCTFNKLLYIYINKQTNKNNVMNNSINTLQLFENGIEYDRIDSALNIATDLIQYKLARRHEDNETHKSLWAVLTLDGVQSRYILLYESFSLIKM